MDLEKKLQILADCDFSAWRKWKRAGGKPTESVHGFGDALNGLFGAVYNIVDSIGKDNDVELIYSAYGLLILDYAKVPFDEMDPQDEDFKFLFEYKEMLDELGKRLTIFIDRCHATGFKCSREWHEFKALDSLRNEMMIKKNYRRDVLSEYGINLSDLPSK